MISRRSLLFAPALMAAAQTRRTEILVVWTSLRTLPEILLKECVVFPRAYAASPQPALARKALETGKFPHAIRPGDPILPFRQLTAYSAEDVVRMTLGADPNVISVATSAAGDGQDTPRERSIHVPLAIRFPGILIGRSAPEILISQVDLMPTLLALADAPVPQTIQGRNLAPLLTRHQGQVPDSVYIQGSDWRAVVRGFDKLVFNTDEEVSGLYNVADDPLDDTDLSKESQHKLTRDGMRALARVWMRRLSDGWDPSGARLR